MSADLSMLGSALSGFALGATLIIAIGAQNAFVLRQGLLRRHVFAVVAVCALSDAVLIAAGVAGLGTMVRAYPQVLTAVTILGAAFLIGYGVLAVRRALEPQRLDAANDGQTGLGAAVTTCLVLTYANPHVYLDTVVLLGGLSGRYAGIDRVAFGAGAMMASVCWFVALGYGARLLAPVFARPFAWRILDLAIALIMWLLAGRLIMELL